MRPRRVDPARIALPASHQQVRQLVAKSPYRARTGTVNGILADLAFKLGVLDAEEIQFGLFKSRFFAGVKGEELLTYFFSPGDGWLKTDAPGRPASVYVSQIHVEWKQLRAQILSEADDLSAEKDEPEAVDSSDSVDAQIDRYFAEYEDAAGISQKTESRRLREAPEDDEGGELPPGLGDDEGDTEGDEEPEIEENPDLTTQNINVESFANSVARLIDNADNLLEFKKTILARAINFLTKDYDDEVVKQFKLKMSESHDLSLEDDNEPDAPFSGFAGPLGGSSGGGP